jgi:hypothetical protein
MDYGKRKRKKPIVDMESESLHCCPGLDSDQLGNLGKKFVFQSFLCKMREGRHVASA